VSGIIVDDASTDCVFDGRRGRYRADEPPNAKDAYGLSKLVGEACVAAPNVVVLRTSIVGPPAGNGRGLLGWFLRQESPVDGWTDHLWNGSLRSPGLSSQRGRSKAAAWARVFTSPPPPKKSRKTSCCGSLARCSSTESTFGP